MTVVVQRGQAARPATKGSLRGWSPLLIAAVGMGTYALFLVVPFRAAGLHHLPLTEVTGGGFDPKDLWPRAEGVVLPVVFGLGGLAALILAPIGALTSALLATGLLVRDWAHRSSRLPLAAGLLAGIASLAYLSTDQATALGVWFLD